MRTRESARLILLDDASRIFLIKIKDENVRAPGAPAKRRPFWVTPGGRVEEGESVQSALARELQEEIGLTHMDVEIGPCLRYSHPLSLPFAYGIATGPSTAKDKYEQFI